MNKFKVGDIVRIRGGEDTPDHYGPAIDKFGVVLGYSDNTDGYYTADFGWCEEHWVEVKLNENLVWNGQSFSALDFFEHELEVYDENI